MEESTLRLPLSPQSCPSNPGPLLRLEPRSVPGVLSPPEPRPRTASPLSWEETGGGALVCPRTQAYKNCTLHLNFSVLASFLAFKLILDVAEGVAVASCNDHIITEQWLSPNTIQSSLTSWDHVLLLTRDIDIIITLTFNFHC